MKYYYLFILIVGITTHLRGEKSELNSEQGKQIDCLVITDQHEEKGVINKADGLMANTPYYIGKLYDEVMPMTASNQFTLPVLKFGIPGKEPEYERDNESFRLGLVTLENRKAVIPDNSCIVSNWQNAGKKK